MQAHQVNQLIAPCLVRAARPKWGGRGSEVAEAARRLMGIVLDALDLCIRTHSSQASTELLASKQPSEESDANILGGCRPLHACSFSPLTLSLSLLPPFSQTAAKTQCRTRREKKEKGRVGKLKTADDVGGLYARYLRTRGVASCQRHWKEVRGRCGTSV